MCCFLIYWRIKHFPFLFKIFCVLIESCVGVILNLKCKRMVVVTWDADTDKCTLYSSYKLVNFKLFNVSNMLMRGQISRGYIVLSVTLFYT